MRVSTDGGSTWQDAELDPPAGRWAWRGWSYRWRATVPGTVQLCCRAADEAGNEQPVDQPWNRQGMANNAVQRLKVVVRTPAGA